MIEKIAKNPRLFRFIMNIWPPFLFSGIKIAKLDDDFKYCEVKLKNWPGTKNINGTQYGGSLFAMTDPIYSIMLMSILGKKYYVWDKEAEIEFKKPGIKQVLLECRVTDEILEEIYEHTKSGEKYFPVFTNHLYNRNGDIIATVKRTLYVRLKPEYRPYE